ncbi:hypothetical protein [Tistrella mobilis]
MKLFFFRRCRRNHVVDEDGEAGGIVDMLNTEIIPHLTEDDIGISRKIICNHEIGSGLDFISGPNMAATGCPRENLLRERVAHDLSSSRHATGFHAPVIILTCMDPARRQRMCQHTNHSSSDEPFEDHSVNHPGILNCLIRIKVGWSIGEDIVRSSNEGPAKGLRLSRRFRPHERSGRDHRRTRRGA